MKNFIILLFCVIFFQIGIFATQAVTLEGVVRPDVFVLSKTYAYIGEKHQVFIFSLPDFKFVKKFGKAGEGPEEFKLGHGVNSLTIDIIAGKLVIGSIAKLSVYSLAGQFIKEQKVESFQKFLPVEKGFISNTSVKGKDGDQLQAIALFNNENVRVKFLLKTNIPVGMGAKIYVPKPNFKYTVYKKNIYLSESLKKINIGKFNLQGIELLKIEKGIPDLKIGSDYKNRLIQYYKTDPNWKNFWNYLKPLLTFPKNFPAVRDFFIDQDLIFVQTYLVKQNKMKWIVFDLLGNLKKEIFLPIVNLYTDYLPLHAIKNGKYFYLEEDLEGETWSVRQSEIKSPQR